MTSTATSLCNLVDRSDVVRCRSAITECCLLLLTGILCGCIIWVLVDAILERLLADEVWNGICVFRQVGREAIDAGTAIGEVGLLCPSQYMFGLKSSSQRTYRIARYLLLEDAGACRFTDQGAGRQLGLTPHRFRFVSITKRPLFGK